MKTTVTCGACGQGWQQAGGWSVFAREAIESRPCPNCGAYTLKSPEPKPLPRGRRYRGVQPPARFVG